MALAADEVASSSRQDVLARGWIAKYLYKECCIHMSTPNGSHANDSW